MKNFPLHWIVVTGLLVVQIVLLTWSAWIHNPIDDEIGHLPSAMVQWRTGDRSLYHVNPPLVRLLAAIPVLLFHTDIIVPPIDLETNPNERPEFALAGDFQNQNDGLSFCRAYFSSRLVCFVFPILGALLCYLFARDLYGISAGLLAMAMWVFHPWILGWGATIYPDVPSATCAIYAVYRSWKWSQAQSLGNATHAGFALGIALVTKLTLILLPLLLLAIWWIPRLVVFVSHKIRSRKLQYLQQHASETPTNAKRLPADKWQQRFVFLSICFLSVHLLYLCDRPVLSLGEFDFRSELFAGKKLGMWQRSNRFSDTVLARLPIPIPENFLLGIDTQRRDFESPRWCFLNGEHKLCGWYSYYILALLYKTPVGFIAIGVIAILSRLFYAKRSEDIHSSSKAALWLLLPAVSFMILVSSQTGFSTYVRYAMPVLPFLFVWASQSVSLLDESVWLRRILLLCMFTGVVESLWAFPNSISFFNVAVGGQHNGHRLMADGALDCGQDVLKLKNWVDTHPTRKPLHISFSGVFLPKHLGIESDPIPRFDPDRTTTLPAGWHIISVSRLQGQNTPFGVDRGHCYFKLFPVVERIGATLLVYHFEEPQVVPAMEN